MVLKHPPWRKASINIFADQIGQEMREGDSVGTDGQTDGQTNRWRDRTDCKEKFCGH